MRELPRVDLARVAGIEVYNQTNGEVGRGVRVFPDGTFDALVPLAPGENRLQVTARGRGGGEQVVERRVFFDAREPGSPEEAVAFEARSRRFEETLRLRALELELAAEARRPAPAQERQLELRAEETPE
ncbi:MAG: hypothetical protein ACR2P8_02530 [Myxococcota bacterium]